MENKLDRNRLESLKNRLNYSGKALESAQQRYEETENDLRVYVVGIQQSAFHKNGGPQELDVDDIRLVISDVWGCTSTDNPVPEFCVYDDENDSVHDHCLFCGEPEERK